MTTPFMGWLGVVRLGLVQSALGAIVVLTTSTLNRVMVVEMALPALLPGLLLGWHYLVQAARPRMGHGADQGRRCTPWILGGMVTLAGGGWLAAWATVLMAHHLAAGVALALVAYALIGLGVAASGTSLLTLLAKRVAPERRAAAATTVWMLMIAGFVVTAGVSGRLLDPFTPQRLLMVAGGVAVSAVLVAAMALFRLEGRAEPEPHPMPAAQRPPVTFTQALRDAWAEPRARRFTVFVFISMLAYSMQDLILEPFAGLVFGLTPGATTRLSGTQHGGALLGMLLAAGAGSRWAGGRWGSLRDWTIWGCVAAGLSLAGLVLAGLMGPGWPLAANVFLLGVCTGAFSIAAIGAMMGLAGADGPGREGVRMGLWGAAQAQAFALGGLVGTAASDLARWLIQAAGPAYALVFLANAALFLVAARLAARVDPRPAASAPILFGQLKRAP
ncbi:BCD family MFS transporter [Roseateles amylovorans]|uniref:BCD family MFS transporter n=1 Tax=Roseateles amylovorans TaxID=2978473 RepID=A0ABY6AZG9_9BURK|nr:BCD family MFS transporter [Roseateles amylovorans]UXH78569.1 BCD family MFS transporter [Roseateles amylovorans]